MRKTSFLQDMEEKNNVFLKAIILRRLHFNKQKKPAHKEYI